MTNKCQNCRLANFLTATECARCGESLSGPSSETPKPVVGTSLRRRIGVLVLVCMIVLAGFFISLIGSATSLTYEEKQSVKASIAILREKGFQDEVLLLETFTTFRASDNWLNASVAKENAYAATNFPFEIITLYPDFFTYPTDETERAAILLHEAKHLAGKDEHDAYEFVWTHRRQLGWTADKYRNSPVWINIRRQTKDNVPLMFVCDLKDAGDCTE